MAKSTVFISKHKYLKNSKKISKHNLLKEHAGDEKMRK